jgi:hypothetical protein
VALIFLFAGHASYSPNPLNTIIHVLIHSISRHPVYQTLCLALEKQLRPMWKPLYSQSQDSLNNMPPNTVWWIPSAFRRHPGCSFWPTRSSMIWLLLRTLTSSPDPLTVSALLTAPTTLASFYCLHADFTLDP